MNISQVNATEDKTWVRIARQGYGSDVWMKGYYYYYIHDNQSPEYAVYRRSESGETTCVLKYKPEKLITTRFYTDGEHLVYDDDGTYDKIYCRKADESGKDRTILNLKKSGDNVSVYRLFGNHLYYSTYHVYTSKYQTYRINVTGKTSKEKISGAYWMASDLNERKADIDDDRYMPLTDKNGRLAVYDDLTGKMRKLTNKKARTQIARVGNDWYYAMCKESSKKKPAINVYKKAASGTGKATKIAAFAKKGVTLDTMAEMTAAGIYFSGDKNTF